MSAEGHGAECARCGAPLALARGGVASCLFCLHEQPLPASVTAPLREDAALLDRLAQHRAKLRSYRGTQWGIYAILGVATAGVLYTGSIILGSAWSQRGDPLACAMFGFIGIGGLAPGVLIPVLWLRVRHGARARVIASLPASTPVIEHASLVSKCPSCGAPHQVEAMELTATCAHCRTEALLPLPLVDVRLARRHAQVLDLKRRGEAEADAAKAAVANWQKSVMPVIFVFLGLFGVGVLIFVILAELRGP